jgi:hypothetical protein
MKGQTARLQLSACIIIEDSYFAGLSDSLGGALKFDAEAISSEVRNTEFFRCNAVGFDGKGGACACLHTTSLFQRCCVKSCDSPQGHFVYAFDPESSRTSLSETSQVHCGFGTAIVPSNCGIFLQNRVTCAISHYNVSFCEADERGAAFFFGGESGRADVHIRWVTCCSNTGPSVIETVRTVAVEISFANFYQNNIRSGGSVLKANKVGWHLTFCTFFQNRANPDTGSVDFSGSDPDYLFSLVDCIFDGDPPDTSQWKGLRVASGTLTATLAIPHLSTRDCPVPHALAGPASTGPEDSPAGPGYHYTPIIKRRLHSGPTSDAQLEPAGNVEPTGSPEVDPGWGNAEDKSNVSNKGAEESTSYAGYIAAIALLFIAGLAMYVARMRETVGSVQVGASEESSGELESDGE